MKIYMTTLTDKTENGKPLLLLIGELKIDDGVPILPRQNECLQFQDKHYIVSDIMHNYDQNHIYVNCTEWKPK